MRDVHAYYDGAPDDVAVEAPVDFAFADTVVAADLDEIVPPSGVLVSDDTGQCLLTPVAYAPPIVETNPDFATRLRVAWARMRYGMKASRDEMNELWSATAVHERDAAGALVREEDPLARAAVVGRRVRTFFSFFEWDRADMLRAAWIGLVVFVLVATAGAFALESTPEAGGPRTQPRSTSIDSVPTRGGGPHAARANATDTSVR
ncbi:MAG: hypothetical protein KF764_03940 [Labilithrix sp.]|nr:hypothetical protein [Labilithrix sp.]